MTKNVGSCEPITGSNPHFNGAGLALIGGLIDLAIDGIFPIFGTIAGVINTIVSEMGSATQYSDNWANCVKDMINMVWFHNLSFIDRWFFKVKVHKEKFY